jgi:hypothetical protein
LSSYTVTFKYLTPILCENVHVELDIKLAVAGTGEYHFTPFDPDETSTEFIDPVVPV